MNGLFVRGGGSRWFWHGLYFHPVLTVDRDFGLRFRTRIYSRIYTKFQSCDAVKAFSGDCIRSMTRNIEKGDDCYCNIIQFEMIV